MRYERHNDHLVEVGAIVETLSLPPISYDRNVALRLIRQSVLQGEFGWHGPREQIAKLLNFSPGAEPTEHKLRLTRLEFEVFPAQVLRAPSSAWAHWFKARTLPVPPWLERSILIEHEPARVPTSIAQPLPEPTAEPAPEAAEAPARGRGRPKGKTPRLDPALKALQSLQKSGVDLDPLTVKEVRKLLEKEGKQITYSTLRRAVLVFKK